MKECSECGKECSMPYTCNICNKDFCSSHRLPENHNCIGLARGGISGEAAIESTKSESKIKNIRDNNVAEKISDYIPNLVTYKFLIVIFIVYILQFITLSVWNADVHNSIFVLSLDNIEYIHTWIISIFSHDPSSLYHILGNSIVLFFFGPMLERTVGSKKFTKIFIFSGIISGLSQLVVGYIISTPMTGVLGASGAILAILGIITVYNPKMKVYLYFMIPVPLWLLTVGYVGFSLSGIIMSASAIAHGAHLVGLLIGITYGYHNKDKFSIQDKMKLSK